MRDIRRFNSGELFGIKIRDNDDGSLKMVVLGTYHFGKKGFNYIAMPYDQVVGPYQALRFDSKVQAQRWIYKHCSTLGYEAEDMQISSYVGSGMFWKVPLSDFNDGDGWVSTCKFDAYSDAQMEKLTRQAPGYFAYHEWPDEGDVQSLEGNYRGFTF